MIYIYIHRRYYKFYVVKNVITFLYCTNCKYPSSQIFTAFVFCIVSCSYAPPVGTLSILSKELIVSTSIMQNSSYELSTLIADGVKCKQTKVDIYAQDSGADVDWYTGLGIFYGPDIKLVWFRSRLEESRFSSNSEELWSNGILFLWMTIYIYIYIYI